MTRAAGALREELRRVSAAVGGGDRSPTTLAAARACLARATAHWSTDLQRRALAELGTAVPDQAAAMAGELLWRGARAEAARWLVAHAPELAKVEALAAAGLLPGCAPAPAPTGREDPGLRVGGTILRRRAGEALVRARGAASDPDGAERLRRADRALRAAWARALAPT